MVNCKLEKEYWSKGIDLPTDSNTVEQVLYGGMALLSQSLMNANIKHRMFEMYGPKVEKELAIAGDQ